MKVTHISSVCVALALVCALMLGGLLHAEIPHQHGSHNHQSSESVIWTGLHAALSHEYKKVVLATAVVLTEMLLLVVAVAAISSAQLRQVGLVAALTDPIRGQSLRRGIHRYRTFL